VHGLSQKVIDKFDPTYVEGYAVDQERSNLISRLIWFLHSESLIRISDHFFHNCDIGYFLTFSSIGRGLNFMSAFYFALNLLKG